MSCDQTLYVKLLNILLEELENPQGKNQHSTPAEMASNIRTYIQAVGAICRQAGHRFGAHVERVVPLVLKFARRDDEELREQCLQACENMMYKCGKEITPHVPGIIDLCLDYICYDPNYNYDNDDYGEDQENNGMDCDEDEEDADESEEEYSDDDDMSWKVRRAAAKCLEATIATRHELLQEFYINVSPALIGRFKEREENVKADIFHAYIALLKQTKPAISSNSMTEHRNAFNGYHRQTSSNIVPEDVSNMMDLDYESGPAGMLMSQVPQIVKALHRQMKERSVKTRQGCFQLLTELILVAPGILAAHIPALIPGIQFSLSDKQSSSNMKIDTLAFVQQLLQSHSSPFAVTVGGGTIEAGPAVFHPHAPVLVPAIIAAVSDPFYKISSEALLVLESLVRVLRPLGSCHNAVTTQFNLKPYTHDIYQCCFVRLRASDIDQEVKERAIACMGQIVASLGDHLKEKMTDCLPIFLDRLKNEITRLTAVKALIRIAGSELRIDLSPILAAALPNLASFLRKNQRALKLSTLALLDILVRNYTTALTTEALKPVLIELPPLVSEVDLHIAQLTMDLLTTVSTHHKSAMTIVQKTSLPEVFKLAQSPLLQGAALNSMLQFFQSLVAAKIQGLGQKELLDMLVNPVMLQGANGGERIHKQGRASIAKCVAALVITQSPQEAHSVVQSFANSLKASGNTPHVQTFSLLAIGEIGRHVDLSKNTGLKSTILESFNHTSEEVKSAASYALGNISLGNLKEYLPFVLREIESQPKRQYLLLHSLKEVKYIIFYVYLFSFCHVDIVFNNLTIIAFQIISAQSMSVSGVRGLGPYVPDIWAQLFKHCECNEEGIF